MNTITTVTGKKVQIDERECYAVLYKDKSSRDPEELKIDMNASMTYPHDNYIGHDDMEGRARGPRFIFDGVDEKKKEMYQFMAGETEVYGIMPVEEFMQKAKGLFN